MSLKAEEALALAMDYADKSSGGAGSKISEKEGNIITQETDGLYANVEEPLIVEMRFNVGTPNCTITSLSETYQTIYDAMKNNREVIVKGYNNSARTDAPLWFYPIGYIANSNMVTFQCLYNYIEDSITAYYLQITSVNNSLNYYTYDVKKQDLSDYQKLLDGTEGQFVSFDADGNAVAIEGLPVRAFAGNGSNDERIEITTSSLKIAKPFRKAIITLNSTLPSTSSGNAGGSIKVEVYRLADGSYASSTQSSPVIAPISANKIRAYNFTVSASIADDGKITMTAGGGYVDIDIANATTNNSGGGGASGNFSNVLVWF